VHASLRSAGDLEANEPCHRRISLHLIQADLVVAPVIQLRGAGRCVINHRHSVLERLLDSIDVSRASVASSTGVLPGSPRALLPEFITDLIRQRSPQIGRIRHRPMVYPYSTTIPS